MMQGSKQTEKKRRKRSTSFITNFLIIAAAAVLLANFFSVYSKIGEKKQRYRELEKIYEQALELNAEYQYLLDEDNQLEYIERIAREKYGYIAPGERAFYDSSYGK